MSENTENAICMVQHPNNIKQRKTENLNIKEAGTRKYFGFFMLKNDASD